MALSELKKQKLKELELNRSGVAFVSEKSHVKPSPTIVISSGGLGGRTVNMLKGKFEKEIGNAREVFFRVLDTDKNDTDGISKIKADGTVNNSIYAHMDQGEIITLYDPIIRNLLQEESIPPYIRSWLDPDLIDTFLQNNGAQQQRQIGRAMLCNDIIYNRVKARLTTIINDAIQIANGNGTGNIDVIIIAGISGGTGSGTIIDLSYMVHDIFNAVGFANYTLAGYIYTPDAQFNEEGIRGSNDIQLNLQNNGYSALKEIDYFMNLEETQSVYKLRLGVDEITCNKNIFSTCTLVSGYSQNGGINNLDVTMGRLTDQLMDMLTDISFVDNTGNPVQLAQSLMSNETAILNAWFINHPNRNEFHRYASYKYQVLGYNSIKIPREEILAYCVNKIYENVLDEFTSFKDLNKQMMDKIYKTIGLDNVKAVTNYGMNVNPNNTIKRYISLDDNITKPMLKRDKLHGYNLAVDLAKIESDKLSSAYRAQLEDKLFNDIVKQIDIIFDNYGPYMALKAIEHKSNELNVGNPEEPFSGIYEQLINLSNSFKKQAAKDRTTYDNGGRQKIIQLADEAIKFHLPGDTSMNDYRENCVKLAIITEINAKLYDLIGEGLQNVAQRINTYNNNLFGVYTEILSEIQRILNKDGQYFSVSHTETNGDETTFSIDIIKNGAGQASKLQSYLDNFVSHVSVDVLARNFIKAMRDNKENWLAQRSEDNFDVVSEVRDLMDDCLINNNMQSDIIEKFVVVAYSPNNITVEELDTMWIDNSPDGPKMTAINNAALQMYAILEQGSSTMAQSASIAFGQFNSQIYISTLTDTPLLSQALANMITNNGHTPVFSNAKNKYIYTQRFVNLPMYILKGMAEFNELYTNHPMAGRHMDENHQNWARFPNPYTIDSVAKDISSKNEAFETIKKYPDYTLLMDLKAEIDEGIDELHTIELSTNPTNHRGEMILYDIVEEPDEEKFATVLIDTLRRSQDINLISLMEKNGYIINRVKVKVGNTDIDLAIRDINAITNPQVAINYQYLPVNVADMYKWIRKSINYVDIIEKTNKKFRKLYETINRIQQENTQRRQFIDNVETFAFCLRVGFVKEKTPGNHNIWNYMDGKDPVTVNLTTTKAFDKKYYLYHVFKSFNTLSLSRLENFKGKAIKEIEAENEVDYSDVLNHIHNILNDDNVGNKFNWDDINEEAILQGVSQKYTVTDLYIDSVNPAQDIERFYSLLLTSME